MGTEATHSNKRIAKNTLMLYFRMVITMVVALYTSRVVLQVLGASDYGLNNVVAGFVSLFTFINSTLASGTQRFMTFCKINYRYLQVVSQPLFGCFNLPYSLRWQILCKCLIMQL